MIDSSPFATKFPLVAPCRSLKLVVTCGTRCARPSQAEHRCRSHLFWGGPSLTVHRNNQPLISCVSSISLCFSPPTLCSGISSFTMVLSPFQFQTPHLYPRRLRTHRRALHAYSASFRTPHTSFALVVHAPTVALLTTI